MAALLETFIDHGDWHEAKSRKAIFPDLCFMVLFNFDLGLLAIQVTVSIISRSEFDHDTERRKTGTETCIARLGVVLLLFMQCKVISRQEKKN